jgi:hypothetical protein
LEEKGRIMSAGAGGSPKPAFFWRLPPNWPESR